MDEFEQAAKGWGLEFQQLERGKLKSTIELVAAQPTSLMRFGFNRRLFQQGQTPKGYRTFGIPERGVNQASLYKRELREDSLLGFHSNGEFEGVSQPTFTGYTLSVSENQLIHVAGLLGIEVSGNILSTTEQLVSAWSPVNLVRARARVLLVTISAQPSMLSSAWFRQELEYGIPAQLLVAFEHPYKQVKQAGSRLRDRALEKAVDYIREHAPTAPTIGDVCEASDVSWRTLDYAFKENFGLSPKQYLMAVRLSRVQRMLKRASPTEETVSNVASRWGFWHMGQFTRDYRCFTGEKPSDTLKKHATK